MTDTKPRKAQPMARKAQEITQEQAAEILAKAAAEEALVIVPERQAARLFNSYMNDAFQDLHDIQTGGAGRRGAGSDEFTVGDMLISGFGHLDNALHAFTRFRVSVPAKFRSQVEQMRQSLREEAQKRDKAYTGLVLA